MLVHHTGYDTSAVRNPHYGTLIERTNVGVTLFFVISGFLLYRPFVAARMVGAPATRLRDFARRRLLRIVPAYWLALTVLAIYPGERGVFTNHWWIYYGFGQIYNDGTVLRGLGQAWSLCVEITFYAALPFYAALMARALRRLSARRQVPVELGLLALICVASWGYRLYLRTDRPFSWVGQHAAGVRRLVRLRDGAGDHQRRPAAARAGRPPRAVEIIRRWPVLPWAAALLVYVVAAYVVSGPHIVGLFGTRTLYFSPREDLLLHILFVVRGRRPAASRRWSEPTAGVWCGASWPTSGWPGWASSPTGSTCGRDPSCRSSASRRASAFVNDSCRLHTWGSCSTSPSCR